MAVPLVSGLLFGAGKILGAISDTQNAESRAEELRYQSRILEQNSVILNNNAIDAIQQSNDVISQAKENIKIQRSLARKTIGQQRVGFAAAGVTLEGSPLDVLHESFAMAEMDTRRIAEQASSKALSLRKEAASLRQRSRFEAEGAGLLKGAIGGTITAGKISAAGQILGGITDLGSRYGVRRTG